MSNRKIDMEYLQHVASCPEEITDDYLAVRFAQSQGRILFVAVGSHYTGELVFASIPEALPVDLPPDKAIADHIGSVIAYFIPSFAQILR